MALVALLAALFGRTGRYGQWVSSPSCPVVGTCFALGACNAHAGSLTKNKTLSIPVIDDKHGPRS